MKQLRSHLRKVVRLVVPRVTFALDQAPDFSRDDSYQNRAFDRAASSSVKFSGWAFKRGAVVALELEVGGRVVERFFPGKKRADVALVHQGEREALYSGFERTVRGDLVQAMKSMGGTLFLIARDERKKIWCHEPKVENSWKNEKVPLPIVLNRGPSSGVLHLVCSAALLAAEKRKLVGFIQKLRKERKLASLMVNGVTLWGPHSEGNGNGGTGETWLVERFFSAGDSWRALSLKSHDSVLFLGERMPSYRLFSDLLRFFQKEQTVSFLTAASEGERAEVRSDLYSVFGYPPRHEIIEREYPLFRGQPRLSGIWLSTAEEILARAGDMPIGRALSAGGQFESSFAVQFLGEGFSSTSHELWNQVLDHQHPVGILLPYRFSLGNAERFSGKGIQEEDTLLATFGRGSRDGVFFVARHNLQSGNTLYGAPVVALEDCTREVRSKGRSSAVQFVATDSWSTRYLPVLHYLFTKDESSQDTRVRYQCQGFSDDVQAFPELNALLGMAEHISPEKILPEQVPMLRVRQCGDQAKRGNKSGERNSGISCILPVYNSLDSVLRSVRSILPQLVSSDELLIVNDCSDWGTTFALRKLASESEKVILVKRKENGGFIAACVSGLGVATPENDILLLNSDVVVSSSLLDAYRVALREHPDTSLFSPFSTGSRKLEIDIPSGDSLETAARKLRENVLPQYPTVITPEGQCLLIRRRAIQALGFLDANYGRGFCEESDLALRYFLSGEGMRVVDTALIFHEQSASFGDDQRTSQMTQNRPLFERRYGLEYSLLHAAYEERGEVSRIISEHRHRLASIPEHAGTPFHEEGYLKMVEDYATRELERTETPDWLKGAEVVFLLPNIAASGGSLSVLQHVQEMLLRGIEARVLYLGRNRLENFPLLTTPRRISVPEALQYRWPAIRFIATHWTTAYLVSEVAKRNHEVRGMYYVQDYEPWFYENVNHPHYERAACTYTFPLEKIAKTQFLVDTVRENHSEEVTKISPGIDRAVFYPNLSMNSLTDRNLHIPLVRPHFVAMFRPSTPRRGGERLLRFFDELLERCPEARVTLFGEADEIPGRLRERMEVYSHLRPKEIAAIYRKAHFVVDLSHFHGFGRTGLEGMACGLVPIMTPSGGIDEYAVDGKNALIGSGDDITHLVGRALHVVASEEQYLMLQRRALETASRYSELRATDDWLKVLGLPLARGEGRERTRLMLSTLFHTPWDSALSEGSVLSDGCGSEGEARFSRGLKGEWRVGELPSSS